MFGAGAYHRPVTHPADSATFAPATRLANAGLAMRAGHVGTWTWDIASGRTLWDTQLEQLHGFDPGEFGGTFADWYESLHPEDRDECVATVENALATPRPYVLLHRTTWKNGSIHWIECRGTVIVDDQGEPMGTTGVAFDVTMHKRQVNAVAQELESGQRLVETLQRALLPAILPSVPGVTLATRYMSARGPGEIGGDWYSAVPQLDGRLGVAIGDVAGHGLAAVSDMAAARFGLRTLAASDPTPEHVLAQLSHLVRRFEDDAMITALYGVLDPVNLTWTYANAGHLCPVVRRCDGTTVLLEHPPSLPLGIGEHYASHTVELSPKATVILYSDGLIERRHEPITDGLGRLVAACSEGPDGAEDLADHLLERLVEHSSNEDDIAIAILSLD